MELEDDIVTEANLILACWAPYEIMWETGIQ